ncbi:putative pentatricopeptide repeat-containing protein-like [Capsicum annuum]|nr:putative pentatricopeptide repeat-containing protein-like [Capsicum annuum]KAF3646827.1 putative pentatricopeptide repeat-containing protein-like [Capsicum annuum]
MLFLALAFAMDYLHNGYSTSVVHYDLKPSNVLLDQEMVGHVSDFGIVKLLGAGETFVQTMTIATIGYTAPEYGQDEIVSMSCDVDSFGILMMETHGRSRFSMSYHRKLIEKPCHLLHPTKYSTQNSINDLKLLNPTIVVDSRDKPIKNRH